MTMIYGKIDIDGFIDSKSEEKFNEYLQKNRGKMFSLDIHITSEEDQKRNAIYKYYYGYLIPDIAAAMGETDEAKVNIICKRDFLVGECESMLTIPQRHMTGKPYLVDAQTLLNRIERSDLSFGMITGGPIFGYDDMCRIKYYIPSKKTLTIKELKEYIKKCESRLTEDLNSCLGESVKGDKYMKQKEAINARKEANI